MTISLATTWRPHGEMPRLQRLRPFLTELYSGMAVVCSAGTDEELLRVLRGMPEALATTDPGPFCGRWMALKEALEFGADSIHYADMDRLIHWAETRPDELRRTVAEIGTTDCAILARSEWAFGTHPQTLQQTESIVHTVFSHLLGQQLDLCSGSKGFSRQAALYLVEHSEPCSGMGTDAEWPVLLKQAGFALTTITVDGLDWETADRYKPHAASPEQQRQLAEEIDAQTGEWRSRIELAHEMIRVGLGAIEKKSLA